MSKKNMNVQAVAIEEVKETAVVENIENQEGNKMPEENKVVIEVKGNNAEVEVATEAVKKERKLTKKEYFHMLDVIVDQSATPNKDELKAFIAAQVKLLDNKKNTSEADKKKSAETSRLAENVLTVLASSEVPLTISEMLDSPLLATYKDGDKEVKTSSQKLTSILTGLSNLHKVVRTMNKKKAYFSITTEKEAAVQE